MTKLACPSCGMIYARSFEPQADELSCDTCKIGLLPPWKLKPRKPLRQVSEKREGEGRRRGSTLKRTQRRKTAAEKRARLHFNEVVKSWPCWFQATRPCEHCGGCGHDWEPGPTGEAVSVGPCQVCEGDGKHRCRGPKDAHHVVPKDFIRQRFEAVLPEEEFVAILFNPLIGAPLCRYGAHEPVEKGTDRIHWEDLSEACLEYVGSLPDFMLLRLERECPKRLDQTAKEAVTTGCQERSTA